MEQNTAGKAITAFEALEKLIAAAETADEISDFAKQIIADSERIKRTLEGEIAFLREGISDEADAERLEKKNQEFVMKLAKTLSALYAVVYRNMNFSADFCSCENAARQQIEPDWSVEIVVDDGTVYVKTPPLPTRNKYYSASKGKSFSRDYLTFFADEVRRKMDEISAELPSFSAKNLSIISAYPTSKQELPDSCNVDTKAIIDAITSHFPGDDAALCCSFFEASLVSDTIQEGAYFVVTEGFWNVKTLPEVTRKLLQLFGKST
jgi:hypothetical protein